MKKRKKQKKQYRYRRNIVEKCVKLETVPANEDTFAVLDALFESYRQCKNMFLERLCGIGSLANIQSFYTLRNAIRAEQKHIQEELTPYGNQTYCEMFGMQGRFWVMALSDTCMTLKSMWTNLGNMCKTKLRDNHPDLTKEERAYCNYVLSSPEILYCILNDIEYDRKPSKTYGKILAGVKHLDRARMYYLHSLLRRIIRDNKPYPKAQRSDCMLLDEMMYEIKSEDGIDYLYLMTNKRGQKLKLKLNGRFCYSRKGNIQVILNREKRNIFIHKCIQTRQRKINSVHPVGIDKGYATLLSCNDVNGNAPEYGEEFGQLISAETERIDKKNTNKNYFYSKKTELLKKLESANSKEETRQISQKLQDLERNHLGNKKYRKQHGKAVKRMESDINYNIRQCMKEMNPSEIILEDLTFTSDRKKQNRKSFNRKMASWQKGYLDERLIYIGKLFGAETEHVNAAYTSQYCSICGSRLGPRYGKHHELVDCEICGTVNANTNAAGNILARRNDKKIMQYTPYRREKEICEERAAALNAAVDTSNSNIW